MMYPSNSWKFFGLMHGNKSNKMVENDSQTKLTIHLVQFFNVNTGNTIKNFDEGVERAVLSSTELIFLA